MVPVCSSCSFTRITSSGMFVWLVQGLSRIKINSHSQYYLLNQYYNKLNYPGSREKLVGFDQFLKLLYLGFQQFPRKVNPAFNSTQRFLQHVCDFVVLVSVEIKQERIPEYFRQAV